MHPFAPRQSLCGLALALVLTSSAASQSFDNRWVEFTESPDSLPYLPTSITDNSNECDFAFGDLDKNGFIDLVVVRKEPFTKPGKRKNRLLMNDWGVLFDRTAQFASASDVVGDQGFLTATNDKNVKVADLNGDTWLDVVTSTTLGDGEPKVISHPRIYINLGEVGGVWQGLEFQESRIPALLTPAGNPATPRFADVAVGDVNGDGAPDLYFVDHDSGVGGYVQSPITDADDHLLINDGNGFFQDETYLRLNALMYTSQFGTDVNIADINQDGVQDIVKTTTNGPNEVGAIYNDPNNEGFFNIYHDFHQSAPYSMTLGDLNRDGRLDVVAGDDSSDRFLYNQSNDALGRVVWGPAQTFLFLSGNENEFVGDPYVVDLDGDGWNDVVICDEDTDVDGGSTSRAHIYHNRGGAIGAFNIRPIEERQSSSSSAGDWVGVVGLDTFDLRGTWDAAIFDLDGDGDLDMILGQQSGTHVWINETMPIALTQTGALHSLSSGGTQVLSARAGAAFGGELYLFLGSATGTSPGLPGPPALPLNFDAYFAFTLGNPNTLIQNQLGFLNAGGEATATINLPPGMDPSLAGVTLHHAYMVLDGPDFQPVLVSNAVPLYLAP